MAFTEFYVQTTGDNLNGGSGTADAAAYTSTNGNWNGTSTFTPTDGTTPASSVSVGDFASVYVDGATAPVYVARVTAVGAGVNGVITLSTTAAAGAAPSSSATARSIKVGGAWKGPNAAVGFPFTLATGSLTNAGGDFPRVNFKAGTNYAITAAIAGVAAGTSIVFQGYTASPGDGGRATIDGGTTGASYILLAMGSDTHLIDFVLQNNGSTGSATGLNLNGGRGRALRVTVHDVCGHGMGGISTALFVECEVYACNKNNTVSIGAFANGGMFVRCVAHDNTGSNTNGLFPNNAETTCVDCIFDTNGKAGCFLTGNLKCIGCTFYNNVADGILYQGGGPLVYLENCLFANNGAFGINAGGTLWTVVNCAFRSNTSGPTNGAVSASGSITLSADPMNDAANGDFGLNATAGGGGACRAAGRGAFTQNAGSYTKTTTGYLDVGAAQHQDAGGAFGQITGARSIGTY